MSSRVGPLRAATSAAPTVSITRLATLNQNVWPGDFNGDGITDLAATANNANGDFEIALGKGDGTFNTPILSGIANVTVLGVGDFNGDHKLDAVVMQATTGGNSHVSVVAGNGDGTVSTAYAVGTEVFGLTSALVADVNGDGKLDIVAITDGRAYVYPGNGDFTFGAPAQLTTGASPLDGVVADLNGDGRKDIVIANHGSHSISIFLNQGGLTFAAADMPLDLSANDVVARDLNGDGKMDLVVAVSETNTSAGPDYSLQGFAYVLLGNGDGTFAQPIKYATAPGAWQIVLGDFTRDGVVDIATANRSAIYFDDCSIALKSWDSVSILPGNGDGTFGAASSFSLADQKALTDPRFKNTVLSLNTADLNRDGATDLIASWGAILINKPADPNWPPSVTAASTQPSPDDHSVVLTAPASDSDQDMLLYSWNDSGGSSIPPVPQVCMSPITLGVHTFTVTADDQHGHTATSSVTVDFGAGSGSGTPPTVTITAPTGGEVVAAGTPYTIRWTATPGSAPISYFDVEYSTDAGGHNAFVPGCSQLPASSTSCEWTDPDPPTERARIFVLAHVDTGPSASAVTQLFSIRTGGGGGGGLPSGWTQADIGAVKTAGSGSYNSGSGEWTVTGDGADIWGTADAFHYAWTHVTGNFQIDVHVDSEQDLDNWTKAGIMIRESEDPGSRHASIFATPGKGVAFQWRLNTDGASGNTNLTTLTAPIWLRETREGTTIRAFYRKNPIDPWVPLSNATLSLPSTVDVGFAVTSHRTDGAAATATLSQVWIAPLPNWSFASVGASSGTVSEDQTIFNIAGKGADIWGTADAFTYMYVPWNGAGTMTVRVGSVQNVNAWTKAGLMIRSSLDAGSEHASVFVTPGKGIAMQSRNTTGGASAMEAQVSRAAPVYIRIRRAPGSGGAADGFPAWYSTDGVTWHDLGTITLATSSASQMLFGMVVTSHDSGTSATAVMDSIRIEQ